MAYIPGCRADVFISYAHRDNLDGWVTRLKNTVTEELNGYCAGHAEVWSDDRIEPGADFKNEIRQQLKNTPFFIAVVSPSYVESEFSIVHELDWFQNQIGGDIIQLVKIPVQPNQFPVPGLEAQNLYSQEDNRPLEGEALKEALSKVVDVIHNKLRAMRELRPKIYVSQLRDTDSNPHWKELRHRLHAAGYAILPTNVLPSRVPDRIIRELLESASLSLHLEGVPDDQLAQRQLEIAGQIGRPPLVLRGPLTRDQLPAIIGRVQSHLESEPRRAVYLIYDHYSDCERVAALPDFIREKTGCDVFLPVAGEVYHKFRLRVSDGVLLFCGGAPEEWLKSQEESLLQAAAQRDRRKTAEAKYFVRKPNGHPVGVRTFYGPRQELIIERTGELDISDLQDFFDALPSRMQSASGQV